MCQVCMQPLRHVIGRLFFFNAVQRLILYFNIRCAQESVLGLLIVSESGAGVFHSTRCVRARFHQDSSGHDFGLLCVGEAAVRQQ